MITVLDAKRPPGPRGATSRLVAPIGPDTALESIGPFALIVHGKEHAIPAGVLPVDADVRPHPHIGLTAISYVLDGSVTHRDSLGNRREIHAGDLGGTVSGRGIVHSERMERMRLLGSGFEMFQLLLAHPDEFEDCEPSFFYRNHEEHLTTRDGGTTARWLFPSPPSAPTGMPGSTPILLADLTLEPNATWTVPDVPERALYVHEGEIEVAGSTVRAGQIAVGAGALRAISPARVLAYGGTNVGPRFMWWNYMHSSLERIEAAKADWRAGRVKLPDGDTESFTPAPADDGRPLWRLNQPG